MKKWLSILGVIGLTTTSTTSLISCQKPNNNKNGGDNKPKPPYNPQQPPENSSWKLIDNYQSEFSKQNNNWYSVLFKFEDYKIVNFHNISSEVRVDFDNLTLIKGNDNNLYLYKKWGSPLPIPNIKFTVYRWDENTEPTTPEIDNNGKIIDWKE